MYTIECRNLSKNYGTTIAIDQVDLAFETGSINMLIGPSGCGKTTLLKMLNRLVEKTSGDILFGDNSIEQLNVTDLRRSIGYVIQETGLFPHFTIYDNIAVVPRLLHWKERKIRDRVEELMELVNLDSELHLHKYPVQLSGGQRQRIGVARALAANPEVLLMDEPFGAIDPINREQLQNGFLEIQQRIKKTVIFVTHDIREAIKLGDTISILHRGKVVQQGATIDVVQSPANEFVEDLLGADRALKGLELLRVKDYYSSKFLSINNAESHTVASVVEMLQRKHRKYMFVCDQRHRLCGYLLLKELQRHIDDNCINEHVKPTESIQPFSNLLEAVGLMMNSGLSTLPVIDDRGKILGVLRFTDLFDKLGELAQQRELEDEELEEDLVS